MRPTDWALLSDDELFNPQRVVYSEEYEDFKRERERRINQKRLEQERIEAENAARRTAIKEALSFTETLAQEICERISSGELLTLIARDEHMPTVRRCQQWLKEHEEFQALFNMSIQDRLFIFEEQVLEIADDMKNDFHTVIKNGKEKRAADPDMVARAKLRIEVRFRHLKAGKPQKWGDVSTLITKSEDDRISEMSSDELERRLAQLEAKQSIVREPRAA
jgi:hypothetical protein